MVPQEYLDLRGYKIEEYYARDWGGDPNAARITAELRAKELKAQRFYVRAIRTEMRIPGMVYIVEASKERRDLFLRPNHWFLNIFRIKPESNVYAQ